MQAIAPTSRPRATSKKARTRDQLLDAALALMGNGGLRDVSILALTQAAGLSNGTFYNYFNSREALLEAVAMRMAEDMATELRPLFDKTPDPAARVALASGRFMAKAQKDPDFGWALLRMIGNSYQMSSLISQYILTDLREGLALGRFRYVSDLAALDLLLGTLLAGIRSVLEKRVGTAHFAHIAEITLCGLGMRAAEARKLSRLALPDTAK